jgi:hypothetical protein
VTYCIAPVAGSTQKHRMRMVMGMRRFMIFDSFYSVYENRRENINRVQERCGIVFMAEAWKG